MPCTLLYVAIVRGLATYFDEADGIDVMPTTSEDGERVRTHVRRSQGVCPTIFHH